MTLATRDQLLHATRPLLYEDVDVPELGPDVRIRVRELSGRERDEYESSLYTEVKGKRGKTNFEMNLADASAKLLVLACVDESGERLFDDEDAAIISMKWPARAVKRLAAVAKELCGMTEEEQEIIRKNSTCQSDDSGTESPSDSAAPSGKLKGA
jgi:hypothetical protein